MGQIKNTPFSLGSIVPKIIDCYSGNQNDARNQKIHSEVMDNFFEVKLSFLTGVSSQQRPPANNEYGPISII